MNNYIERLKNKDEAAFDYVYHQTKHVVYALIVSIIKDRLLAEDIMQDTYIEMVSSIHSYQPKYKFLTWLLTIARNKSIDMYRKRKREGYIELTENEYVAYSKSTADDDYQASYLLSILDDLERQVISLYVFESLKHKEIAKILDKPLGTILWVYQKAMKKLREAQHHEG